MHHATLPASGALRQATASIRNDQLHALEAALDQVTQKADQPDLSSLAPSQMPRISRCLGSPRAAEGFGDVLHPPD
jgi:hypothetical protein